MGMFTRRRAGRFRTSAEEPLADAVAVALAEAGFETAGFDGYRAVGPGFTVTALPLPEPRVAVDWHTSYGDWTEAHRYDPDASPLGDCAEALENAGYQTEFVADFPGGYLAVWLDGEF